MTHTLNENGQPIGLPLTTQLPRPFPSHRELAGQSVLLVPVETAHAPDLFTAFAAGDSKGNWTYLPYGPFSSKQGFANWMATTCFDTDPMFFTICTADRTPVGLASFLRIDPDAGVIEVGHIHFSPRLQGTPLATDAMFAMMSHVFDDLGYRRYEWKCDALNGPSRRAAERLGFTYEGTFRKATSYKGRNRDTAWFSIINDEWPALKIAFQSWLSPENFTSDGKQRRSLSEIRGAV